MELFSVSSPSVQRSWNGTIFLHVSSQPHEISCHSDGLFLCLSTERHPLWGRLGLGCLLGGETEKSPTYPPYQVS